MLREKLKWRPHKSESTDAEHRGGITRSLVYLKYPPSELGEKLYLFIIFLILIILFKNLLSIILITNIV